MSASLLEEITMLAEEYEHAADNPDNASECMYDQTCGEFAVALREIIEHYAA